MEINQSRGTIQSETISTIIITTLWLVAYKLPNYAIISFLPLCLSATAHKLWPTFIASLPVLTQLFFNSRHGRDKATEASERLSFKCSDSWKARPKMSWDQGSGWRWSNYATITPCYPFRKSFPDCSLGNFRVPFATTNHLLVVVRLPLRLMLLHIPSTKGNSEAVHLNYSGYFWIPFYLSSMATHFASVPSDFLSYPPIMGNRRRDLQPRRPTAFIIPLRCSLLFSLLIMAINW